MSDKNKNTNGNRHSPGRRTILKTASSVPLVPLIASSCSTAQPIATMADSELTTLSAFVDRIIPEDASGPGAITAGVPYYIRRSLNEWNQSEEQTLLTGLRALNAVALEQYSLNFAELTAQNKDALMTAMEAGELTGFANAQQIFNRLHRLTLEGMFSDPYYGGNQNYVGWDLIGYPGAVMGSTPEMQAMGGRLAPVHTSAYGSDYDGD